MLCVSIEIFKHDIYYSILFWTVKIFYGKTIYIFYYTIVILKTKYQYLEVKKIKNCS